MRPDLRQWYCIWAHPQYEFIAEQLLIDKGFTTFLPTVKSALSGASKPLFPRYLFTRFDMDVDPWRTIYRTVGVRTVLSADDKPLAIPDPAIDRIKAVIQELTAPREQVIIRKGAKVEILIGLYKGRHGICQWSSRRKIGLLMELLNQDVQLIVERHNVELV